jgi:hypothetical protein
MSKKGAFEDHSGFFLFAVRAGVTPELNAKTRSAATNCLILPPASQQRR